MDAGIFFRSLAGIIPEIYLVAIIPLEDAPRFLLDFLNSDPSCYCSKYWCWSYSRNFSWNSSRGLPWISFKMFQVIPLFFSFRNFSSLLLESQQDILWQLLQGFLLELLLRFKKVFYEFFQKLLNKSLLKLLQIFLLKLRQKAFLQFTLGIHPRVALEISATYTIAFSLLQGFLREFFFLRCLLELPQGFLLKFFRFRQFLLSFLQHFLMELLRLESLQNFLSQNNSRSFLLELLHWLPLKFLLECSLLLLHGFLQEFFEGLF